MSKTKNINQISSEEITNVVILMNGDDPYFDFITNGESQCLMPLVNVPLIYYTMLSLIYAKFKNFKIFCGKHIKKIKEFFKMINFNDFVEGKCEIQFIDENIKTPGDSIRYLDKNKTDKGFLLVYGDLVTDIKYNKVISDFQMQRNKNPNIIMAQVLSTNLPEELKIYSKTSNNLIVNKENFTIISLDDKVVSKAQTSIILDNMYDPQIYVCSNKIPLLFKEHFDCFTMDDLIKTVVSHSEILPDDIQIIPVSNSCFRVHNLSTFSYTARRLMHNDIDGLSPVYIFGNNLDIYYHHRTITTWDNTSYYNRKLPRNFLPSSSKLIGNCQIQNYSKIGSNCRLENCVIGYKCQIGNNVTLRNCTIHDEVTVGNNSTIIDSFISSKSIIGANCFISEKSVISSNCCVPADSRIDGKLLSKSGDTTDTFWTEPFVLDPEQGGKHFEDVTGNEPLSDNEEITNEKLFARDLLSLLRESYDGDISIDNLFIETNRLKHQYAIHFEQVCFQLMEVFIDFSLTETAKAAQTATFRQNFMNLLERFGLLLTKFTEGSKRPERIMMCLEAVEEVACSQPLVMEKVLDIFYSLYDQDLVEEDEIVEWFEKSSLLEDQEFEEAEEESD